MKVFVRNLLNNWENLEKNEQLSKGNAIMLIHYQLDFAYKQKYHTLDNAWHGGPGSWMNNGNINFCIRRSKGLFKKTMP